MHLPGDSRAFFGDGEARQLVAFPGELVGAVDDGLGVAASVSGVDSQCHGHEHEQGESYDGRYRAAVEHLTVVKLDADGRHRNQ